MQVLQPINEHQQPVKITTEYIFQDSPQTRCLYHPQQIKHFCKEPSCLMPLCQDCIQIHPHQHSRFIDSIESTLTQVYRGYARRANEIATHQRGDILQIRQDLHKLIDAIIDDVLHKADQNYQHDLVLQWRNLIKILERLKDPNACLKEVILFFAEPDQGYYEPKLCYQGSPIQVNYEALEQARFHLHHLFMVNLNDGEYFFKPGERTGDNPIQRVSRMVYDPTQPVQLDYQPYNYTPPKRMEYSQPLQVQPLVLPPQQIVYATQSQTQPILNIVPQPIQSQPQQVVIQKTEQPPPQPLVFYQESPIKAPIKAPTQQTFQQFHVSQQQQQPIIQYVQQPTIRTPQTVPSIYAVSSVKPFLPTSSSGEYSHPYPLSGVPQ